MMKSISDASSILICPLFFIKPFCLKESQYNECVVRKNRESAVIYV